MSDVVIRIVALLGGLLLGLIAWITVALIMRASVLTAAGLDRLRATRFVLFGLLLTIIAVWLLGPVHGSPWIWPGVVVGITVGTFVFLLARAGRLRLMGAPFGRISEGAP